jgi:uncharacterized membrane protein YkoI
MKARTKFIFGGLLAAALVTPEITGWVRNNQEQVALLARAKISKTQALQTALGQVPGGVIQSGELKNKKGGLVWLFDFSPATSEGLAATALDTLTGETADLSPPDATTEVAVNALTGNIVSVKIQGN